MGNKQVKTIFKIENSSWPKELSVLVADSVYSQREFIGEQVKEKNLVTITRVRSDLEEIRVAARVFYRQFIVGYCLRGKRHSCKRQKFRFCANP